MPGLYSHTTRTDGTTLTASIYNADHVNHITNLVPDKIDDYSASVTQSNVTSDPGEAGAELLATNLAQELEQLRFILAEMKGVGWRTTLATRTASGAITTEGMVLDTWLPAGTTALLIAFPIPDGWTNGTMTCTLFRRGTATGTAIMGFTVFRSRPSSAIFTSSTGSISITPADANTISTTIAIVATDFALNDMLLLRVERNGDNGGDDMTSAVSYDGHRFAYMGTASR